MSTTIELSHRHRFVPATSAGQPPILLLHGTGGDENDLLPLGPAWCTDRLAGAEELSGVGERPFPAPGCRSCHSSSTRTAATTSRASGARSRTGRPTTPAYGSAAA